MSGLKRVSLHLDGTSHKTFHIPQNLSQDIPIDIPLDIPLDIPNIPNSFPIQPEIQVM